MTDMRFRVKGPSLGGLSGIKKLLTEKAPAKFDSKRIANDAKEVNALLAKLSRPIARWDEVTDCFCGLSYFLRRYGIDVPLPVPPPISLALVDAPKDDPWGTDEIYCDEDADEQQELASKNRAA
jgi:hypothetical protein